MFSVGDLEELTELVTSAWRAGAGGDWSSPAGTVTWSCAATTDHAADTATYLERGAP